MADFVPSFDQAAAYPEVAALRAALSAGDWAAVRALHDPLPWEGRQLLVFDAAEQDGVERFLRSVIERDPHDLVATTMYAVRLVVMGWSVRTGARAKDVSDEQFKVFFDHLRQAEEILLWACARDPMSATAWCERVVTARGLQLGQSEARRRYERAVRHLPHYLPAQSQLLQQLCPKWSGDFATMHAFARQCTEQAPPGAHNGVLVVEGHVEHWLELESGKDAEYITSEAVKAEIRMAGERSVLHPDFRRTPGWVRTVSTFALGFSMIRDWPQAKYCFTMLGPYADRRNWDYLNGGAEQAFAHHRALAMEHG
jgi:hypothetical protein